MLANAMRICEAQCGFIYRMEAGVMGVMAEIGVTPALAEYRRNHPTHTGGPTTLVDVMRTTKKPVHVHDARESDGYRMGNPNSIAAVHLGGARTALYVPMLKEDEIIGAINLYRQEVRPFTDKQIELVQTFADQAVIAIENARLLNELRQRTDDLTESLEQQTATSEVLQVISSSPGELEPIFNAMLANATRICEAKFGNLLLFENGVFRRAAIYGAPPDFAHESERNPVFRPNALNPISRLITTKQAVHVADMATEQGYLERDPVVTGLVEKAGLRTAIVVPMLKESELIGAIGVYRQEVRPFTEKQIELLKNFAAQAVIAIENARLLNELRQRTDDLSESLAQQTATSEVLQAISNSPGKLQPVFDAILENAVQICEARFGTLTLFDGNQIRYAASYNVPAAFKELRQRERWLVAWSRPRILSIWRTSRPKKDIKIQPWSRSLALEAS